MTEAKTFQRNRKRVVIVDDSRAMQSLLETLFSARMGYEVVGTAGDAKSGLAMVHRLRPDIVTIGLQMPYIDGRDLLDVPNVLKIVISESASNNLAVKARLESLGADACFGKSEISRDSDGFCRSLRSLVSNAALVAKAKLAERHQAPPVPAVSNKQPIAMGYPVPLDERERLSTLAALHLANDNADHQFDLLTSHLVKTTGFPACAMTFIDRDTQWMKSAYGIDRGSMARAEAVCNHTLCGDEPFIVDDLQADHRFNRLECVVSGPKIRSYVGYPIIGSNGLKIGVICLLDTKVRRVTETELTNLRSIARIAAEFIESRAMAMRRAA